jgi:flagellar hook protein FlgE
MLRSMYSGISGLKNFQTKLDVIGNNIANVNTYGFKKERTIFKDLISQTQAGASAPSATRGGVNAIQVGLGSQLAAIDTVHSGGSLQTTARTLDLGISGEGFFMVADGTLPDDDGIIQETGEDAFSNVQYTRAGNFYMDRNGYLVNGDGKYLVGVRADGYSVSVDEDEGVAFDDRPMPSGTDGVNLSDEDGVINPEEGDLGTIRIPTTAQSMSIGQDGTITYVDYKGDLQFAGQILMAKFPNASGLEKTGSNYFQQTANSGDRFVQVATVAGMGNINSGFLEMSNVDLSEEFTEMIVAQRGFQANSRIITTSDEILQELVNLKR